MENNEENLNKPSNTSSQSIDTAQQIIDNQKSNNLTDQQIITPQAQNQPIENNLQTAQTQDNTSLNVQNVNPSQAENKRSNKTLIIVISIVIMLVLISTVVTFLVVNSKKNNLDTQKNDAVRVIDLALLNSEISNFTGNNNGKVPTFVEVQQQLIPDYIFYDGGRTEFNDPSTNNQYVIVSGDPQIGEIQYAGESKCSGGNIISGSTRQSAVRTLLESGKYICVNS